MTGRATERGLETHWKVRVAVNGAILHLASRTEPRPLFRIVSPGGSSMESDHILGLKADWVTGTDYGDTPGYIDWESVDAVTWRLAEEPEQLRTDDEEQER
jgi:hypothetical protein